MSFWNNPDIELKIKSRFLVSIADGFFLPNVKSVSKPSRSVTLVFSVMAFFSIVL